MAGPDDFTLIKLPLNGLPVVCKQVKGNVECCGVAIMAGSRDEDDEEFGLAHFVEHTIFKGTRRRRSHHVINRMETVGGELNAYTTKEETLVYTLAPAHNTDRAMELIADLVVNCVFPDRELDKEREVVADEIDSYLDSPDAAVYDEFEDLVFAKSQLGHNILGSRKSLERLDGLKCRSWVDRFYRAGNMAFFYVGPASERRVLALAEKYFESVPVGERVSVRVKSQYCNPFNNVRTVNSHQAHTVTGCRIDSLSGRDYDVMGLLNNILGGPGMNSLFNISLREHRGLVYTVDSSVTRYCDCALWSVYFGCDDEHTDLCKCLIYDKVKGLADVGLSQRALKMAKRQFLGQIMLTRAAIENLALSLGRSVLRGERFRSVSKLNEDFDGITLEQVMLMARRLIEGNFSSLTFR